MPKLNKNINCQDCSCSSRGIFCDVGQSDLISLGLNKVMNTYKKGQTLYFQGNPAFGLYCINSGKIKISKVANDGKETIIRIAGPGDVLGHQNIFSQDNYTSTATVIEEAMVCFMDRNYMVKLIESQPSIAINIIKKLSNEVNLTENQSAAMSHKNVRERLAELLLYLKETYGVQEDNRVRLNIKLTREEMASMIGTANETVIRFISELRDDGIVEQEGKIIFIVDNKRLAQVAHGVA